MDFGIGVARTAKCRLLLIALATAALVVSGCSSDSPTSPSQQNDHGNTGVIRGAVDPGEVAFEYMSATNGDPSNPIEGPFAIRGRNVRYEAGALIVDLSVANLGEETYPEPVTLTFLSLLPEGVTVTNADNEETGPGASIDFAFENDDALWTPGEESMGRATNFGVAEAISIAFIARLDAGTGDDGMGTIGGMVWNDANADGIMDVGEVAVEGATIALESEGMEMVTTTTAADGSYAFTGLAAGFYSVSKVESESMILTTASPYYVTLVESSGVVSSFLAANFGCKQADSGTGTISGTVFNDADQSGTRDEGEAGLEGLDVRMTGPNGLTGMALTGADGVYSFSAPEAGEYLIYLPVPEQRILTTPDSVRVTLEEGGSATVDFGVFEDDGGGNGDTDTVSGYVYVDENHNRKRDEGEAGIEGVRVKLCSWSCCDKDGDGDWYDCQTVESDADGAYSFEGLEPGKYLVTSRKPDGYHRTTWKYVVVRLEEDSSCTANFGFFEKCDDGCDDDCDDDDDDDDDEDNDSILITDALQRLLSGGE